MGPRRSLQFLGWGIVARALIVAAPVVAQTPQATQHSQDWAWCKSNQESGVSVDRQIQGCTTLMQTKGLSPAELATAYNARGMTSRSRTSSRPFVSIPDWPRHITIAASPIVQKATSTKQ
jgi:hypothetical protein